MSVPRASKKMQQSKEKEEQHLQPLGSDGRCYEGTETEFRFFVFPVKKTVRIGMESEGKFRVAFPSL